jgi:DNA-binding response OmpR family regulator
MTPALLLIDDAPEIDAIVRVLVRKSGFEVVWCPDGESTLSFLAARTPALALLDLNLGSEDGLDLYARMKNLPACPLTALFTQQAEPGQLARGLDLGIEFFVDKGLIGRPADWRERVAEVLEQARRPPFSAGTRPPTAEASPARRALRAALSHPTLLALGGKVVEALLRRAAARVAACLPENLYGTAIDVGVSSGSLGAGRVLAEDWPPNLLSFLMVALGYQAECLLGRSGSAPLRSILNAPFGQPRPDLW